MASKPKQDKRWNRHQRRFCHRCYCVHCKCGLKDHEQPNGYYSKEMETAYD